MGYLVFLPYQSVFIPNYLIKDINTTRNIVIIKSEIILIQLSFLTFKYFQINIKAYLEKAILNRHLILTVPFIVEFLSMEDENAMSIDINRETVSLLINIFRFHFIFKIIT